MKKRKRGRPKGSTNKSTIVTKSKPIVKVKTGDKVIFEWLGVKEVGTIIEGKTLYDGTFVHQCKNREGFLYPIKKDKIIKKL